jgi:hypothetical protein
MGRTIRKSLIEKARLALNCIDFLDEYIWEMHEMHQGRQPAIEAMGPILLEGHEQLRRLWRALKDQL